METCDFCGSKNNEAEHFCWTDEMDIACSSCFEIIMGAELYKDYFSVHYLLPKLSDYSE